MVGRQPEVVDHELRVRNRHVVADQGARRRLAERSGRDDEVVDRHDPAGQARDQVAEMAVHGEHHEARLDPALSRRHDRRPGFLGAQHATALEDAHAGGGCGIREPQNEVQRVQMAGAGIEQAADVAPGRQHVAQLARPDIADVRIIVRFPKMLGVAFETPRLAGLWAAMRPPGLRSQAIAWRAIRSCTSPWPPRPAARAGVRTIPKVFSSAETGRRWPEITWPPLRPDARRRSAPPPAGPRHSRARPGAGLWKRR